jgi:hypothetical protein
MGYCTYSDVRRLLPRAIKIQGENPNPHVLDPRPESLTTADIDAYIDYADSQINALVGAIYDVPLQESNQGGKVKFPEPVPFISAAMAAWMIFQQRLSGADKATGEYTERMYKVAMSRLQYIVNGQIILRGQTYLRSSRTIKGDLFAGVVRTTRDPADFSNF